MTARLWARLNRGWALLIVGLVIAATAGTGGFLIATKGSDPEIPDVVETTMPTTTTRRPVTTTTTTTTTTPRPTLRIVVTHPDDLAIYLNEAAIELMGRRAPSEAHVAFVKEVHDLEAENQRAAYRGEPSYRIDPRALAYNYIESHYSAEVGAYRYLQGYNCLMKASAGEDCE